MPMLKLHIFASQTCRQNSQCLQKSVPALMQEEFRNIFSFPSIKIKTPYTQTDTKKTHMLYIDNGLQTRLTGRPVGNSVAIAGEVINRKSVHLIKHCAKRTERCLKSAAVHTHKPLAYMQETILT